MKKSILALAGFALAALVPAIHAADVTGKITLKGTPPPEKTIAFDDICGALHPTVTTTRHYVLSQDNGLANVFIYISKGAEGRRGTMPGPAEINQEGCMYHPYLTGVMVGQTLKFKNSDTVLHNVHGLPAVDGNLEFNFAQPTQGDVNDTKWTSSITKPEVLVKIKCEVHNWMFCYVGVQENSFFAVSDKQGNFKISGLPEGTYTLTAYHLKATAGTPGISQEIKVGAAPVTANFTLEVPAPK